ncbi:iron-sulfur cluster assembly accessory protein [Oscillatoria sp. FACHB-1406]|uniref:HesB/IscA family protein n=1 Tax=Oscillatoria sp. FACHB-1406 TaxID=2692846 RepID=UPI0016897CCA|nr:iron-sulfur cluster assembly accessory protein [Oscillatoria sp. FACHB-1406]MBD2578724.1 iron-sulfur cluster assembly accessory protein [Oscillatoria sp. FACHB-1406]
MVNLTQAAAREVRRLQASNAKPDTCLRLAVKSGGCAGLYYVLELTSEPEASDRCYVSQGIAVAVEEQSHDYLHGLKLDYSEDLMGGGFRFQNPNVLSPCSCGYSFSAELASI